MSERERIDVGVMEREKAGEAFNEIFGFNENPELGNRQNPERLNPSNSAWMDGWYEDKEGTQAEIRMMQVEGSNSAGFQLMANVGGSVELMQELHQKFADKGVKIVRMAGHEFEREDNARIKEYLQSIK